VALIVPDLEFARAYARQHDVSPELARLVEDTGFRRTIGEAIDRANQNLSVIERVRRFRLMPEPFSVENGLLTPTMKLKRQRICRLHQHLIDGLYEAGRQQA
jgi:long-chain acyl-CoA synthetase